MVVLRVDRSLEARADRSRGSIGASSPSGVPANSQGQPRARAADHTANTKVSMLRLSGHAPCPPTLPGTTLPHMHHSSLAPSTQLVLSTRRTAWSSRAAGSRALATATARPAQRRPRSALNGTTLSYLHPFALEHFQVTSLSATKCNSH